MSEPLALAAIRARHERDRDILVRQSNIPMTPYGEAVAQAHADRAALLAALDDYEQLKQDAAGVQAALDRLAGVLESIALVTAYPEPLPGMLAGHVTALVDELRAALEEAQSAADAGNELVGELVSAQQMWARRFALAVGLPQDTEDRTILAEVVKMRERGEEDYAAWEAERARAFAAEAEVARLRRALTMIADDHETLTVVQRDILRGALARDGLAGPPAP